MHRRQINNSNLMHTLTSTHLPGTCTAFPGIQSATKQGNNTYHSWCLCGFFFPSIPFCLSAFIPRSVSLSLCLGPIYYPFCSTVYSIHKQIQLLRFIKPVISLVDCTTACERNRGETQNYVTNSPSRAFLETLYCLWGGGSCYYAFLLGLCFAFLWRS